MKKTLLITLLLIAFVAPQIQADMPVELVGQWGGSCYATAVSGNRAYMGMGTSLLILDISQPSNPTPLGQVTNIGYIAGVAVSGNYAYVADYGAGLQIIDVSNPAAPVCVGGYDTSGYAEGVAVLGSYAYVADGEAGLQIIDVSNPSSPIRVGGYDTSGEAYDVAVSGNYAYVADDTAGLQIIDISNPSSPVRVGGYDTSGHAYGVAVSGNYAYVADWGADTGLKIIDVSNSASPVCVGSYYTCCLYSVVVSSNYAYVADGSGLQIIDVSNPANPVQVGNYNISGYAVDVTLSGNYAYVADGEVGLQIIDISNPTSPARIGRYYTNGYGGYATGVAVSGSHAYVADCYAGLQIIDISNPTNSVHVGGCDTSHKAWDVAVSGSYAYVADGSAGLQIIDISNPANPIRIGACNTSDYAYDVDVLDNHAYVADGFSGLQVIDISNPANPVRIGGYYNFQLGCICGVTVSDNYAYLSFWNNIPWMPNGLAVIDITNPAVPVCVGGYDTSGAACGVAISANYAYVADGDAGLQIIDVSNPSSPVRVGGYDTSGEALSVVVSGNYAYVADDEAGLQIIDVSNPSSPIRVGGYDTSGYATGVAVSGNYAYVADDDGGLVILRIGLPPADPPTPNIPAIGDPITAPPGKNKLIVITHGWSPLWDLQPNTDWITDMVNAFHGVINNSVWDVQTLNWIDEAHTCYSADAVSRGYEQGLRLGRRIADANQWQHVHLIAHSAGSAVIAAAAEELVYQRLKGKFSGTIHLTFLDPYTPNRLEDNYARFHDQNDWADNYYTYDITDMLSKGDTSKDFDYAHNVNISNVDINHNHDFPHEWYHATITGSYPKGQKYGQQLNGDNLYNDLRYGFPRGLEAGEPNWQESLNLPVGNHPVIIGESLLGKPKSKIKTVAKKIQNLSDSYIKANEPGAVSVVGNFLQMFTQSPVWAHTLIDMPNGTNYVKFTYQFNGTGDGYLTAYFNENLVLIGDQRFDSNQPHDSGKIMVADLMQDYDWLTFRLDQIGQEQANIFISNIEIGTITNMVDLNDDLTVNFMDFAAFANKWSAQDCNESNNWCQGCDFDQSGTVDVNDAVIFSGNWLWKLPKHIPSDLNFSTKVDFSDFSIFANQWFNDCNSPDWCYGSDFDKSGKVDVLDLEIFAQHWLEGVSP